MPENMILILGLIIVALFVIFRLANGKRRKAKELHDALKLEEESLKSSMRVESTLLPTRIAVLPMHAAARELLEIYALPMDRLRLLPDGLDLIWTEQESEKRISVRHLTHQQYLINGRIHMGGLWEIVQEDTTERHIELADAAAALEKIIQG